MTKQELIKRDFEEVTTKCLKGIDEGELERGSKDGITMRIKFTGFDTTKVLWYKNYHETYVRDVLLSLYIGWKTDEEFW